MNPEIMRQITEVWNSIPGDVRLGLGDVVFALLWMGPKILAKCRQEIHFGITVSQAIKNKNLTLSDAARLSGTTPQKVLEDGMKFRYDELHAMTHWRQQEIEDLSRGVKPMKYSDKPDKRVGQKVRVIRHGYPDLCNAGLLSPS